MILDLNPVGQLAGLGPQVALVTTYGTQPIVSDMRGSASASPFPLAGDQEYRQDQRGKAVRFFGQQPGHHQPEFPEVSVDDPNNRKGPLTIAAAGTYNTGKPNSQGRFVVIGSSSWAANRFLGFNGNSDLALNSELAFVRRGLDLHPSQAAGRPPHHHDPGAIEPGAGHQPIRVAADGGDRRNDGLVEEKIRAWLLMNFRGLMVAVVVLAILGGVLYWSQHRKPPEDNAATSASATPVILKVDPAE